MSQRPTSPRCPATGAAHTDAQAWGNSGVKESGGLISLGSLVSLHRAISDRPASTLDQFPFAPCPNTLPGVRRARSGARWTQTGSWVASARALEQQPSPARNHIGDAHCPAADFISVPRSLIAFDFRWFRPCLIPIEKDRGTLAVSQDVQA